MSKLQGVVALFAVVFALSTGCASESECGDDGRCVVGVQRPGNPPRVPRPDDCASACANLLGECGAALEASDSTECERECRADFTDDEIDCLAGVACGEPTDACLR